MDDDDDGGRYIPMGCWAILVQFSKLELIQRCVLRSIQTPEKEKNMKREGEELVRLWMLLTMNGSLMAGVPGDDGRRPMGLSVASTTDVSPSLRYISFKFMLRSVIFAI